MITPRVEVDIDKIRHNACHLVQCLGRRGIAVTGVTKAVCGHPEIAQALLDGGVSGLADARIENIEHMRRSGILAPISLLRPSTPAQADRVVRYCTASYNTELDTIRALGRAALRLKIVHEVILMIEMGDMREGIMPDDLADAARAVIDMPGVVLKGIGANFACLGGIAPDARDMIELNKLADEVETVCGLHLDTISGGNSANLPWALGQVNTLNINDLRLGEAIMLGVYPLSGHRIDGLFTDAFSLFAEVIESKMKPNAPSRSGSARDMQENGGIIDPLRDWRSILAIGNQDTDIDGLTLPTDLASLRGTSDQFVIKIAGHNLPVGTEISLQPNYSALMRVMNASSVAKVVRDRKSRVQTDPEDRYSSYLALV